MRPIRQIINQKPKNSGFFERYIKKNGDRATLAATDEELRKSIKSFYNDLMNGFIQQEKYEPYLKSDVRLLQLAIQDSEIRMTREWILLSALQFGSASGLAATANPLYKSTYDATNSRYRAYGIINQGLRQYFQTGNMAYLVAISVQIQDPMNRQFRPEL